MAFENEIGAQAPLGFGILLASLAAPMRRFARLRYVEVKRNRISMLAIVVPYR
jgi:hypothetical protein